ncbi:MAG: conjugal transfer protein TraF [Longimicrobiales bacterium]|nr:conjugal transfer protein TraF [Longimicrobiales bacterium]
MRTLTLGAALTVLGLLAPVAAGAQVASPVPEAVGLGGSYTALARGIAAPAWNPAGLGMPDNPGASFALLPFSVTAGLSPVTPADLAEYDGQLIPAAVRQEWLAAITEAGGETGNAGAEVTFLALGFGPVALSASSTVRGQVNLAPDVAEVLFFGNAGLTGDPQDYSLQGSNFDVAGTTTFAASMGFPLSISLGPLPDQHFAVGATVKYTVGNFLMLGQESRSTISSDPIAVDIRFPIVHSPLPDDSAQDQTFGDIANNGGGFGLDIGAAWQGGPFSAGVVVKNVVNTFEWDLDGLQFREGTATWDADSSSTSFDTASIANAPGELIDRIETLYGFSPTLAAGAAMQVTPFLEVTGELRHSLEESLNVGERSHLGVGAELTILPVLPIRAGVAAISGGYQLSGGLGLRLGPVQLAFSAAARQTDLGDAARMALGLTYGL